MNVFTYSSCTDCHIAQMNEKRRALKLNARLFLGEHNSVDVMTG